MLCVTEMDGVFPLHLLVVLVLAICSHVSEGCDCQESVPQDYFCRSKMGEQKISQLNWILFKGNIPQIDRRLGAKGSYLTLVRVADRIL